MVAVACALSAVTVLACGLAQSLTTLTLARIATALTAAWIIPLGMAFVGDAVPYERRQQVLGRYLTGQITGQLFGQAAGGIIGDLLGWRAVFFILSARVRARRARAVPRARDQSVDAARSSAPTRRRAASSRTMRSCCRTRGRAPCCSPRWSRRR